MKNFIITIGDLKDYFVKNGKIYGSHDVIDTRHWEMWTILEDGLEFTLTEYKPGEHYNFVPDFCQFVFSFSEFKYVGHKFNCSSLDASVYSLLEDLTKHELHKSFNFIQKIIYESGAGSLESELPKNEIKSSNKTKI